MTFTPRGLRARSILLDAAQAEIDALPEATSGRESVLQSIMIARQMLATGNVRAAHSANREVCNLLEREGRPTTNLERLNQIAHDTR